MAGKSLIITIILFVCATNLTFANKKEEFVVTRNNVNIRAKASLRSEVVGQVSKGDKLIVKSKKDEWVEIIPPAAFDMWVHRDLVENGVVNINKLNVRSGAGINYNVVGSLKKNDKIESRGEFGEWLKIAPPSNSSLWVSKDYVKPTSVRKKPKKLKTVPSNVRPNVTRTPQRKRSQVRVSTPLANHIPPTQVVPPIVDKPVKDELEDNTATVVVSRSGPAEGFELPADWELIPLEGQGRRVEREGVLKHLGFAIGRPTRFRLINYDGDTSEVVCYVRGNDQQLSEWSGTSMIIRGRIYWIKNARYPVLIVDELVPKLPVSVR